MVPALLMVSTIRFRSFKTIDLGERRRYQVLVALAALLALIVTYPHEVLLIMAYSYLRVRLRRPRDLTKLARVATRTDAQRRRRRTCRRR